MSLTENPINTVIRSIRVATGRFIEGPAKRPLNASKGSTGASSFQNNYGSGRGQAINPAPDGRQWVAPGGGTSQERHTTTRLPGER